MKCSLGSTFGQLTSHLRAAHGSRSLALRCCHYHKSLLLFQKQLKKKKNHSDAVNEMDQAPRPRANPTAHWMYVEETGPSRNTVCKEWLQTSVALQAVSGYRIKFNTEVRLCLRLMETEAAAPAQAELAVEEFIGRGIE